MYQLVYTSAETCQMRPQDLADMLNVAHEQNQHLEITGIMLYRNGTFIHVMEGKRQILQKVIDQVKGDSNQQGVTIIQKGPIAKREFDEWSMGFLKTDGVDIEKLPGYSDFLEKSTVTQLRKLSRHPSAAFETLMRFKGG